jgi:hypothetical protein
VNENYKIENAKLALSKDRKIDYDVYRDNQDKMEAHPLTKEFLKVFDEQGMDKTLYLKPQVQIDEIGGYKNVKVDYVTCNSGRDIAFWVKFDVENPNQAEIDRLQAEFDAKYNHLKDEEFLKIKPQFRIDYGRINKLSEYIPDFTYFYIFDMPTDKLEEILYVLRGASDTNAEIERLKLLKRKMLFQLDKFDRDSEERYELSKEYWKVLDAYDDLVNEHTPTEEELAEREARNNKSKADYDKENAYLVDIAKGVVDRVKKRMNKKGDN